MHKAENSQINQPEYSQPLCTALQIALVNLLKSFGVSPTDVIGHSSGEIAAAYCAKAIDSTTAMKIAYYRGVAAAEISRIQPELDGAMLAVGASEEVIEGDLKRLKTGKVVVACINSNTSTTVSGDVLAIDELKAVLDAKNIFARKLAVKVAYHSPQMGLVDTFYRELLGEIKLQATSSIRFWSSVTSKELALQELSVDYWAQNLSSKVRFAGAFRNLCAQADTGEYSISQRTIVEIGPHSALSGPIASMLLELPNETPKIEYLPGLVRQHDAILCVQTLAGKLLVRGHKLDSLAINLLDPSRIPGVLVDLPPYAWNHTKGYWHSTRHSREYLQRTETRSSLLGSRSADYASFAP